ncbi:uncharacterized protein [Penaeus vannamei]|uniref:uncharacterized protein n=1 Tax=Penaeus vannamei TaxID=6689 RepID=UPI00387F8F09
MRVEMAALLECIMEMRLKLAFGFMSHIAVYAPTDVCKLDVKEISYTKLAAVSDSYPWRNIQIGLGDFNTVSGCDRAGYMSVGPHGSGPDAGSENSLLFRDFARSQKLRISGSWYQCPDPHHWTWYSDGGCIGVPSSVVLTIDWMWLPSGSTSKLPSSPMITRGCLNLDRLKEGECSKGFAEAVSSRFAALKDLTGFALPWNTFKCETLEAA